MAIAGPLKVDCAEVFPHGLGVVGGVEPLADFNASTKDNRVQAKDKDTGLPMWSVEVLDFDPHAREKTHRVKVASAVQPVPPEAVGGVPVRPVVLEGLTVTPYIAEGPGRGSPTRCGAPGLLRRAAGLTRTRRPDHGREAERPPGGVAVAAGCRAAQLGRRVTY